MKNYKLTYTIFGEKGSGKTTLAFSAFKGQKFCFSLDRKAERIKEYFFNNSSDITIANTISNYIRTTEEMTQSARVTYQKILEEIKNSREKYDWIIIDGLEKLGEICEMTMRNEYKLSPFQGIPQTSYWKLRKVLLSSLHQNALDAANKGVIYTTFSKVEDIYIEDGQVIERREMPKYFDMIEEETDVLLKTFMKMSKDDTRFFLRVSTSKLPRYKTGSIIDFTRKEVDENADK